MMMTGKQTDPTAARAPAAAQRRRVGSLTLGLCLIATGIFFLLYYFVPVFPWQLVLKIAPAVLLVVMGGEVLYFATRPGQWKYDFVSVLVCLCLVGLCFCLTLLPLFWDSIGPERHEKLKRLSSEYEQQLSGLLQREAPDLRLRELDFYLDLDFGTPTPETLDEALEESRNFLSLELRGPYQSKEDFAADCRRTLELMQENGLQPRQMNMEYDDSDGSGWYYRLSLNSVVAMHWTEEEMAEEIHAENYREELDDAASEDLDLENLDEEPEEWVEVPADSDPPAESDPPEE